MAAFDAPNRHPIILFCTYGDCSRHIVDQVHGRSKEDQYQFVTHFFRPYVSRLPGYDAAAADCVPRAVLTIRNGVPERQLWFCGEHTAPFEECGTVTGAYLSGQAAAEKILAAIGQGGGDGGAKEK